MINIQKINLIHILLIIIFFIIFVLFFFGEHAIVTLIIPLVLSIIFSIITYIILFKTNKDKFVPKCFIITVFFHFIVAIFIQLLKYYILNLPIIDSFAAIGIDNDGYIYNQQAIQIAKTHDYSIGLFYSKIVGAIYSYLGINEFTVCSINCIISGFISVTIYLLAKKLYKNRIRAYLLTYIVIFSFTVAAYTTVLMRDVYIILLTYLIIYNYYLFYKKNNILYLILSIISFLVLCPIRAYAAGAAFIACVLTNLIVNVKFKVTNNIIKLNRQMILILIVSSVILSTIIIFQGVLGLDYIVSLFDMDNILQVSEIGYGGANSSFGIDRVALSKIPPLFILVGYFCMLFAPFPHQWLLAHNIVQAFSATETIILYIFLLPSFFKGIQKGFEDKNFIIISSFLYILFVFTFYGMILDNSGAVFRGRAPFIPLIYLISLYNPQGLLKRIFRSWL